MMPDYLTSGHHRCPMNSLSTRATGASSFFLAEEKSFLRTLIACVITRDKPRSVIKERSRSRQHSTLPLVSCLTRHVSPYQESSGQPRWLVPHPTNADSSPISLALSLSLFIFPKIPEKPCINIIFTYFFYIFFFFIAAIWHERSHPSKLFFTR